MKLMMICAPTHPGCRCPRILFPSIYKRSEKINMMAGSWLFPMQLDRAENEKKSMKLTGEGKCFACCDVSFEVLSKEPYHNRLHHQPIFFGQPTAFRNVSTPNTGVSSLPGCTPSFLLLSAKPVHSLIKIDHSAKAMPIYRLGPSSYLY